VTVEKCARTARRRASDAPAECVRRTVGRTDVIARSVVILVTFLVELANFNTKCHWRNGTLSKIGGKEGRLQGEAGRGQGLHDSKAGRAHPTHRLPLIQDAASSIQDQVAGMPAIFAQAALPDSLTAALSKSVAADKGGKRQKTCATSRTENTCALSIGPSQYSQHTMEAF
jgi:hypothetical protein